MELGSWGSRKEVVLGQGPLTPSLFIRLLGGNGEHCLRYQTLGTTDKDRFFSALFLTRPPPWALSSACPILLSARILLSQFSKNPPNPEHPGRPSARILLSWFSKYFLPADLLLCLLGVNPQPSLLCLELSLSSLL